jgi:hypothetical protein
VACEILGINYNTTRLATIIDKYQEKKKVEATKRAEKRGKPATEGEIQYTISSYLEGNTVDSISSALYRSPTFIRAILDKHSVPIRRVGSSYFSPTLIPEECMRDKFKENEIVYSARYDSLAKIKHEYSPGVYHLYLLGDKWQQFCYQPVYELASLEHLKKYMPNG